MKKIVYIGNKLAVHGNNPTTIDTLSVLLAKEGCQVITASSRKNKLLRIWDMMATVVKYSRSADFVLIDTYSTSNFWYAFIISQICRILKLKYIPYLHGGNLPKRLQQNPVLSGMLFNHSYKNVAPSAYLMDQFKGSGIPGLIQIPNVIERDKYHFKPRTTVQPKLLWVRSFTTIYNPKMAVDVACELQQEYPETELCMVGPDKDGYLDEVKKYAELRGVNVRFTGKLTKKEWITLSAEYDIFISTSHFDNTPVSIIEAIALGMPVVTTNVGGIPFLLDHQTEAKLVPDGNVTEMVQAIAFLIENPNDAQTQIRNAYQKIMHFDWKEIKKQWMGLFGYC